MAYRQFPHSQYVTIGTSAQTADYVCNGTNDETPINNAISYANANNISTVLLLPGTYFISNKINLLSNVHLTSLGLGTVAIVIASGFNDNSNPGGICAIGSNTTGTAITLASDIADGNNTFTVTTTGSSGTEFALLNNDDFLQLKSNALWESTEQSGRTIAEFVRVNNAAASSNTFTIYGMTRSTYKVSDSASLFRQSLVTNPTISNIEMYQQAALGTRTNPQPLINLTQTLNANIYNCKLHDSDQAGILVKFTIGTNISDCHIYQLYDNPTNSQLGYAVQVLGAENTVIKGCKIYKVRHGLTTGGGNFGIARGIDFIGNTVSFTTNSCVDTHNQSESVNISGNTLTNSVTWACFIRGRATNFIGNTVEWCGGGVEIGLSPYQVSGGSGTGSKIIGNTFRNIRQTTSVTSNGSITGSGVGVLLALTDNCIVQNNTFENIALDGIQLNQKVSKCIFSKNTFMNCNLNNSSNLGAFNLLANISTTAASITAFSTPTVTLTYTGTGFANYHVGQTIVISGAATSANNGSFTITAVTANNTLQYSNASAVAPDGNNGSITARIEQNTDNIFENNIAINTGASTWDPNSTGGNLQYFCFDAGTNTSGSNVRNTFKNNTAMGMTTGLFNITNSNSFFAGNSTTESEPVKTNAGAITDSLFESTPQDGTIGTDTTNNYGYVRSGGTWYSMPTSGATIWDWENSVNNPVLKQLDQTTGSTNGKILKIQAQNATGTTSTGGQLALTSGTGTTAAGSVVIQTGGTTRLTANASGVVTVANLGTGVVHADSSGNLTSSTIVDADISGSAAIAVSKLAAGTSGQILLNNSTPTPTWTTLTSDVTVSSSGATTVNSISGSSPIAITPGTLQWTSGTSNPTINQANNTASSGTGQNLVISAQRATGTTSTGGNLFLTAGDGTSTNGSIRLALNSGSGATTGVQINPSSTGQSLYAVVAGATSVVFKQTDNTTNSATASPFTIQAQNATGTTATGGQLALTSGSGTTAAGSVVLQTGGTTRLTANASGVITVANLGTGVVHADSSGNLTSSTIVDADVSSSAAIAGTKINPAFGAQNISTTGTLSAGQSTLGSGTSVNSILGSIAHTTKTFSTTGTIDTSTNDYIILADTSGGAFTLTLPAPTNGRFIIIKDKKQTFATNNLTIARHGTEKIDGTAASLVLNTNNQEITFTSDGTDWYTTGASGGATGTAGGDLSGSYPNPTVAKINGSSVPAGGALTTGNVLQVNGASSLTYAAVNLAGGSNFVTGNLPISNVAPGSSGQILMSNATPATTWTTLSSDVTISATGATTVNSISGSSPIAITPANLQWASTVSNPTINQASTSGTASNLIIQAQSSTGGNGGSLVLEAGTSSVANNSRTIQLNEGSSSAIRFQVNPTATSTMTFQSGVTAANINWTSNASATTNAGTLTISGQGMTVDTFNAGAIAITAGSQTASSQTTGSGGAVSITAGSTAGSTSGNGGNVTLTGGNSTGAGTGTGGNISLLAGSSVGGAGGSVILSANTGTTNGLVKFRLNNNDAMQLTVNNAGSNSMTWVAGATSVTLNQSNNTTNSATAATMTIQAQNATGTTAQGGQLVLTSGTGTSQAGTVVLQTGGTTRLTVGNLGVITIANLGTGVVHADSSGNLTSSTIVNTDVSSTAAISYSKLGGTGTETINSQEFDTNIDSKGTERQVLPKHVQTTDATVTTLDSFTLASNTAVTWAATVTAIRSDDAAAAGYQLSGVFKNNAGTVTQVGAIQIATIGADDAAWAVNMDFSGTTIRLRVTGKTSTTIQWSAISTRLEVIN